jgi:hypothetical protein
MHANKSRQTQRKESLCLPLCAQLFMIYLSDRARVHIYYTLRAPMKLYNKKALRSAAICAAEVAHYGDMRLHLRPAASDDTRLLSVCSLHTHFE